MQSMPGREVSHRGILVFFSTNLYVRIVDLLLVEDGWKPWDYCAGSLILQEAGGSIFTSGGGPFHLLAAGVACAATEGLARELVDVIVSVAPEINEA